jgi:SAM-dependent methyltransferase
MTGEAVTPGVVKGDDEPAEKTGMRNAWGRVAVAYDELFAERLAHLTGRGLDLLTPEPHWDGLDIACGPGLTTAALAERLPKGHTLGIDFAEPMVARAGERFSGPGLGFAVDDAERLSQPTAAFAVRQRDDALRGRVRSAPSDRPDQGTGRCVSPLPRGLWFRNAWRSRRLPASR